MKAREVKRAKLCAKYAEKRKALKEAGDWAALDRLPKNSSPCRQHNRCSITGRPKGYMRVFGISRIQFREMASKGLIPGVRSAISSFTTVNSGVSSLAGLENRPNKAQQL